MYHVCIPFVYNKSKYFLWLTNEYNTVARFAKLHYKWVLISNENPLTQISFVFISDEGFRQIKKKLNRDLHAIKIIIYSKYDVLPMGNFTPVTRFMVYVCLVLLFCCATMIYWTNRVRRLPFLRINKYADTRKTERTCRKINGCWRWQRQKNVS